MKVSVAPCEAWLSGMMGQIYLASLRNGIEVTSQKPLDTNPKRQRGDSFPIADTPRSRFGLVWSSREVISVPSLRPLDPRIGLRAGQRLRDLNHTSHLQYSRPEWLPLLVSRDGPEGLHQDVTGAGRIKDGVDRKSVV